MPLTLKTAAMKYKNANGEYVGVNAIAEETTAEAVADIQAESATQQAAIEAKGVATRASIPDDYTTLSDDVTDLKGALNNATAANIQFVEGRYKTNGETVDWLHPDTASQYATHCAYAPCKQGDVFHLNISTGGAATVTAILDAEGNVLQTTGVNCLNTVLQIKQPNAAWIVFNARMALETNTGVKRLNYPAFPTTAGTYTLALTVTSNNATLSWVSSGASLSMSPLMSTAPADEPDETDGEGETNDDQR